MSIRIRSSGTGYEAVVTPSEHMPVTWASDAPMHGRDVITKLLELGFHQQDIVDAFATADPEFITRLNRGDFNAP